MPRRSPRTPREGSRRVIRAVAAVAVGAVITTGGVALTPAPPAQAAWQGSTQSWISGLNGAIGAAGPLFGPEGAAVAGVFNIALSLAGPLISSIFGDGDEEQGPGIQDVLDKLQELDDIEHKLDEMSSTLATIETEVLKVDAHVLLGTCSVQISAMTSYIAKLKVAQSDYTNIIDHIKEVQTAGTDDKADKDELENLITAFIGYTMGGENHKTVNDSMMAEAMETVHAEMMTGGGPGVIRTCGEAYFAQWKVNQTSAAAVGGTGASQQGVWLDDRQYYEPLQNLVQYWQTAQAQGMFLLQQASLMQATKFYVQKQGSISPENAASVCRLAKNTTHGSADAATVCDTGLRFSRSFYDNIVAEWREVGLPISNDKVVLSLGTDVTGLAYGSGTTAQATTSAVWARTPSATGAAWSTATWDTTGAAVRYDDIPGFVPAGSQRWLDLDRGYRASHPSVVPAVQTAIQSWRGKAPWDGAKVKPYAPLDILATMRASQVPSFVGSTAGGATFDANGVELVWLPKETSTHDFHHFANPYGWGYVNGLAFPPSAEMVSNMHRSHYYDDTGLSVKCSVTDYDGVLCDSDTVGSWFIAKQRTTWSNDTQIFRVTPGSDALDALEAFSHGPERCDEDDECTYHIDEWQDGVFPNWLAPMTSQSGVTWQGDPSVQGTLWPVAPLPTECRTTSWGAPTRCGTSMDAWIRATIPNPSIPGPQPTAQPVVAAGGAGTGTAVCPVPAWRASAPEAGIDIQYSDVTWTGTVAAAGTTAEQNYAAPLAHGTALSLATFVTDSKWTGDPTQFTLRCTVTARWADLASTTTVDTVAATARKANGVWVIGAAGAEEPGEPGEPTPTPAPAPGAPDSSGADAAGAGELAATGSTPTPWLWLAPLAALVGVALTITATGRRRRHRS